MSRIACPVCNGKIFRARESYGILTLDCYRYHSDKKEWCEGEITFINMERINRLEAERRRQLFGVEDADKED